MGKDVRIFTDNKVSLAGSSKTVSGIRRLAQRVLLELLTDHGSMPYQSRRGCTFVRRCRAGMSEYDVIVAFAAARSRIKRLLKTDVTADTPKNEQLADMRLGGIFLGNGQLIAAVLVISRAGDAVQVDTPPIPLE